MRIPTTNRPGVPYFDVTCNGSSPVYCKSLAANVVKVNTSQQGQYIGTGTPAELLIHALC